MNATILNGALAEDHFVDEVASLLADDLGDRGYQVQPWTLREEKIAFCLGCFECWTKTPGLCRIDDAGRSVAASAINSDVLVYVTAVTFGGYSSELKKAVDRLICLISPFFTRINGEVHHHKRYAHYPTLLVVGVLPAANAVQEEIFQSLVGRNALNLHAPTHSSGFIYRQQSAADVQTGVRACLQAALPVQEGVR